jgi:hypothetical protein
MAEKRIGRAGQLAIGLAVLGSIIATVNEVAGYRDTGTIDWGHVALIVGVPLFMYAIVASSQKKQPR